MTEHISVPVSALATVEDALIRIMNETDTGTIHALAMKAYDVLPEMRQAEEKPMEVMATCLRNMMLSDEDIKKLPRSMIVALGYEHRLPKPLQQPVSAEVVERVAEALQKWTQQWHDKPEITPKWSEAAQAAISAIQKAQSSKPPVSDYDAAVRALEYSSPGQLGIKLAGVFRALAERI